MIFQRNFDDMLHFVNSIKNGQKMGQRGKIIFNLYLNNWNSGFTESTTTAVEGIF